MFLKIFKPLRISNAHISEGDDICIGGCNKGYTYNKISYGDKERNLCYDCFIDKNEELSKKYNIISEGKCLIKIK